MRWMGIYIKKHYKLIKFAVICSDTVYVIGEPMAGRRTRLMRKQLQMQRSTVEYVAHPVLISVIINTCRRFDEHRAHNE